MERKEIRFRAHEIREHLIRSTVVAQTFRITVLQPIRRTDDSERFPVLYVTDGDEFFGGLANLTSILQLLGEAPRYILVGIGYENARSADLLRMRDLVTHAIRKRFQGVIERIAGSPLVSGVDDLRTITQTTDAKEFLYFIRNELMPFISANYPAVPDDSSYSGYSAGGTFGLITLFTQPDTFRRYILGSPATSYGNDHFGMELAQAFLKSGHELNARVFLSVGELEEFDRGLGRFDLVTGYYLLVKFLREAATPGLELTARIFPGETHATAWTLAFSHGLKALFGRVDQVPYWPDFSAS